MLDVKVANQLKEQHQELRLAGEVLTEVQLSGYYSLFREKFGPDRLSNLDGRDLLYTLHSLRKDNR